MKVSGILLCGGEGSRIGARKEFIEISGKPMMDYPLSALRAVADTIILVTDRVLPFSSFPYRVVSDIFPGSGAMGGIHAGLYHTHTDYSLVLPCDTPLMRPGVLKFLVEMVEVGVALVVPEISGRLEMVCAIYSRNLLKTMERAIRRGETSLLNIRRGQRWKRVSGEDLMSFDPELLSFFNVNTRRDLKRAEALLKEIKGR